MPIVILEPNFQWDWTSYSWLTYHPTSNPYIESRCTISIYTIIITSLNMSRSQLWTDWKHYSIWTYHSHHPGPHQTHMSKGVTPNSYIPWWSVPPLVQKLTFNKIEQVQQINLLPLAWSPLKPIYPIYPIYRQSLPRCTSKCTITCIPTSLC